MPNVMNPGARYVPLEETRIDKIYPPNRLVKDKLDDQTAYNLLHQRASTGRHGRDPVHLILEKLWFVSIAHYVGLHSFDSFEVLQDLDPNLVVEDAGYTANHIFRLVQANVARKSRASPHWDVLPNSPDLDDQEAAKVAKKVLEYLYEEKGLKKLRRELAFWTETCGTAFIYANWDKDAGPVSRTYEDMHSGDMLSSQSLIPREKEILEQLGKVSDKSEGDWDFEVISPFQVKLPHWFVYFEKMPWVVIERLVPIDWLWDHYPEQAPHIQPDEITTNEDNEYWRRLSSLVNRHGFALPSRGGFEYEAVQIREMWIQPGGRFPKGAKIVGTMSRLLENSIHPFLEAGITDVPWPLVDFHHARVPGRFWSMGTVEHLIGPQREYNRARTQVIQQRDILSNAQWLAPKDAELTSTRNEYGDIMEYSNVMGGKPELVNPPSLSQAHVSTIQDSLNDMERISANSQASLGEVPSGLRSGVALQTLQEKDTAVVGPTIEDMEDGFQKVGTIGLKLFHSFGGVPRAIRIYGESRQIGVQIFKGSDLNGNTTVRVQQGSMMPRSRAATESTLMDLLQAGGLNPAAPKDRRILFEALEVGDIDKIFMDENLSVRRAMTENMMFFKPPSGPEATFPDVEEHDDHQIHYEEHIKFMRTDAYELLPFARKLAFKAHLDKHMLAVARMMEAQMGMAGMGAAGGGSEAKQPGQASQPRERQATPGTTGGGES